MQSDLEEAKTQENTKLQSALEDIQFQFQETKTLLIKEREAVKIAAEQAPIVQEVPVIDHEIVNKLTAENEQLKVRLLKLWCMSFLELPWIVWICLWLMISSWLLHFVGSGKFSGKENWWNREEIRRNKQD